MKQKEAERKTFGDCGQAVLANKLKEGLVDSVIKSWVRTIEVLCDPINARFVDEIETSEIVRVIQSLAKGTGEKCQNRIEEVFAYSIANGFRQGPNPAAWKGHLEHILPKRQKSQHHAVLHYKELGAFLTQLRSGTDKIMSRLALEWLVLTATRSQETRAAKWNEIDLENAVWVIPAERMKTKLEHKVPLARRALEILDEVKRWDVTSDFIFALL